MFSEVLADIATENELSPADRMFEELGYNKIENKQQINYVNNTDTIVFLLSYKKIEYHFLRGCTFRIQNMQELQAINKKVEELGWNEKN